MITYAIVFWGQNGGVLWILEDGFWDDTGVWVDDDVWND